MPDRTYDAPIRRPWLRTDPSLGFSTRLQAFGSVPDALAVAAPIVALEWLAFASAPVERPFRHRGVRSVREQIELRRQYVAELSAPLTGKRDPQNVN